MILGKGFRASKLHQDLLAEDIIVLAQSCSRIYCGVQVIGPTGPSPRLNSIPADCTSLFWVGTVPFLALLRTPTTFPGPLPLCTPPSPENYLTALGLNLKGVRMDHCDGS